MITLQHVNPTQTRAFMGTLTGGVDVHTALAQVAQAQNITAGTVELLGGLTEVEFTEYDFLNRVRKPALKFARALEIVAGHGTLSLLEDEPFVHLHLVCSFQDAGAPNSVALIGGHAARAVAFAVEFTLIAFEGVPVHRALHVGTGLKLWKLSPLPAGEGPGVRVKR